MTINALAIKQNGLTISQSCDDIQQAADFMDIWLRNDFYNSPKNPIVRCFFGSNGEELREFTTAEVLAGEVR